MEKLEQCEYLTDHSKFQELVGKPMAFIPGTGHYFMERGGDGQSLTAWLTGLSDWNLQMFGAILRMNRDKTQTALRHIVDSGLAEEFRLDYGLELK